MVKRAFLITMVIVMTLAFSGCKKEEKEETETPAVLGGWTEVEDGRMSKERVELFYKALDDLEGVDYVPLKLLETQVVSGTNYRFLCNATPVTPDAETYQVIITIYEDLKGNAEVTDISRIAEEGSSAEPMGESVSKTDAYVAAMGEYEDMEIACLGEINLIEKEESLSALAERTLTDLDFDFVSELLNENRVVYGKTDDFFGRAYLIIPAAHTDVTVGEFNAAEETMGEIYFKEEDARPFIYIESRFGCTPTGILSLVRYYSDQTTDDATFYTGFDVFGKELRVSYKMGIVDVTDYDYLAEHYELTSYSQYLFDIVAEADKDVADGKIRLDEMDELLAGGRMYAIFAGTDAATGDVCALYGVNYENGDDQLSVLKSTDDGESWEVLPVSRH